MARGQRYINTRLWEDNYVAGLRPLEKLLWLYLLTTPLATIAGIFEITVPIMRLHTGLSAAQLERIIAKFEADKRVTYRNDWVIMTNAPKHQIWQSNENVDKGIRAILSEAPAWILDGIRDGLIPYAYPSERLPVSQYPSKPPPILSYPHCNENLNSHGRPVDNVLKALADQMGPGTPKGAGAMKVRAHELGTPVEQS